MKQSTATLSSEGEALAMKDPEYFYIVLGELRIYLDKTLTVFFWVFFKNKESLLW